MVSSASTALLIGNGVEPGSSDPEITINKEIVAAYFDGSYSKSVSMVPNLAQKIWAARIAIALASLAFLGWVFWTAWQSRTPGVEFQQSLLNRQNLFALRSFVDFQPHKESQTLARVLDGHMRNRVLTHVLCVFDDFQLHLGQLSDRGIVRE